MLARGIDNGNSIALKLRSSLLYRAKKISSSVVRVSLEIRRHKFVLVILFTMYNRAGGRRGERDGGEGGEQDGVMMKTWVTVEGTGKKVWRIKTKGVLKRDLHEIYGVLILIIFIS